MKILSIGNSFSQDAQRYLFDISYADNNKLYIEDLVIGGCSLQRHCKNMLSSMDYYSLEVNGSYTGIFVSLFEAITSREWDVITIQQVSHEAPYYDKYQPYLNAIIENIRLTGTKAKIVLHQTWAYEQNSPRLNNELGYADYKDMLKDIINSYDRAAKDINADYIIPSGELLSLLLENGVEKVHRDTFHATLGLARYAIGLLWYRFITGRSVENISFNRFDEPVIDKEIEIAKKCVEQLAIKYGK
jgi:hypothetical protein